MTINLELERPQKVKLAIRLILSSILITITYGVIDGYIKASTEHQNNIQHPTVSKRLISMFLEFIIYNLIIAFFLYKTYMQKNWARILCSFALSFDIAYFLIYCRYYFTSGFIHAFIQTLQATLQCIAVVFLNNKEVYDWYKTRHVEK